MLLSLIGIVTVFSKPSSIFLLDQLFQDGGEHGKTSGFYDCGPTVPLLRLWIEYLGQKQYTVEYYNDG